MGGGVQGGEGVRGRSAGRRRGEECREEGGRREECREECREEGRGGGVQGGNLGYTTAVQYQAMKAEVALARFPYMEIDVRCYKEKHGSYKIQSFLIR